MGIAVEGYMTISTKPFQNIEALNEVLLEKRQQREKKKG